MRTSSVVVVDDQTDLLDIDTTGPHVSRDEHSAVTLTEILHNAVSLLLGHIAVHAADGKVGLAHLVGEPVNLAACVAENDSLCDILLLDGDEVLLETFEGQFVTLDENTNGIGHELGSHIENIVRQGGTDDHNLGGRGKVSVNIVDLLSESLVEELVSFIEDQHLDMSSAQVSSPNHVRHTAWGTRDNVLAVVELADIFTNVCSSDTSVALDVHVVTQRHDDGLDLSCQFSCRRQNKGLCLANRGVDDLQHTDGKGSSLSSTGLSLGDGVATLADLDDGSRLNSGRRLVSVSVDTAKEVL
ncbi:hypothetical protein HG531_006688 [Fusarium graminearum]|nr:hypothetical protein HG531_006688 [Fusarium graminearum]